MPTGEKIRALRMSLGDTQAGFAARFGVTKRAVIGWEAGQAVRRRHCADIAALAGVTQAEFFYNEDVRKLLTEIETELATIFEKILSRADGTLLADTKSPEFTRERTCGLTIDLGPCKPSRHARSRP